MMEIELGKYLLSQVVRSLINPLGISIKLEYEEDFYNYKLSLSIMDHGEMKEYKLIFTREEVFRRNGDLIRMKTERAERGLRR